MFVLRGGCKALCIHLKVVCRDESSVTGGDANEPPIGVVAVDDFDFAVGVGCVGVVFGVGVGVGVGGLCSS